MKPGTRCRRATRRSNSQRRRARGARPGRPRDALEPLEWLVQLDDDAIIATGASYDERVFGEWAWSLLGLAHFALGDDAAAADAFGRAEQLAPDGTSYAVRRRLAERAPRLRPRRRPESRMSFPWHDPPWCEVGDLLASISDPGVRVLAPDPFWWRFPSLWRYVPANLTPDADYDWVVVHKGELPAIPRPFLEHVVATTTPVLANEVFVVFAADPHEPPVPLASPHLLSFLTDLAHLPPVPDVELVALSDRVLEASPTLRRFGEMVPAEARAAQDEFFRNGGYRYPTGARPGVPRGVRRHRDRAAAGHGCSTSQAARSPRHRCPPTSRWCAPTSRRSASRRRSGSTSTNPAFITWCATPPRSRCRRSRSTSCCSSTPSSTSSTLRRCSSSAPALRPGGELLLTFSNTNSLNQILTRALGYPTFVTNHQHVREFTPDEVFVMLGACGFDVVETAGIELRPYWGVPGIDHIVRETLDEDPELVAALAEIGRRVGIECAYVGVVTARKRA